MGDVVLDATKARLLEAAGEEFAERGLEGATVRRICERAGANMAAINYHFGGKDQLYACAVGEAYRCGAGPMVPEEEFALLAPAEQLRQYIRMFLGHVLAISRERTWQNELLLREMIQPTEALGTIVEGSIRPRFDRLREILGRICPEADPRRGNALAFSVIGQCLHYKMGRQVARRLIGDEALKELDLDYLTDHITGFTLAALGLTGPLDEAGRPASARDHERTGEGSWAGSR